MEDEEIKDKTQWTETSLSELYSPASHSPQRTEQAALIEPMHARLQEWL